MKSSPETFFDYKHEPSIRSFLQRETERRVRQKEAIENLYGTTELTSIGFIQGSPGSDIIEIRQRESFFFILVQSSNRKQTS